MAGAGAIISAPVTLPIAGGVATLSVGYAISQTGNTTLSPTTIPAPISVGGGYAISPPIVKDEGFSQTPALPTPGGLTPAQPLPSSLPGGSTADPLPTSSAPPITNPELGQKPVVESQSNATTNEHHSDPKFMGGDPNQPLTTMPLQAHQDLHSDLNKFLKGKTDGQGNDMSPRNGNSGAKIRQNFTQQERDDAMQDFYQQHGTKYPQAAKDYTAQKPPPPPPPP